MPLAWHFTEAAAEPLAAVFLVGILVGAAFAMLIFKL
jgi:hypothetical protein